MYVSLSDIIAALATVFVAIIGAFLLFVKIVNRRRRRKRMNEVTKTRGNDIP